MGGGWGGGGTCDCFFTRFGTDAGKQDYSRAVSDASKGVGGGGRKKIERWMYQVPMQICTLDVQILADKPRDMHIVHTYVHV